ncbi:MAG: helix-turn-helix domain-containing protein [Cytophagales bacterium]|nr:helix-turn-helix domain-containing protein [Cytophagales bacterium]
MIEQHLTNAAAGIIRIIHNESIVKQDFANPEQVLTIAWNRGSIKVMQLGENEVELAPNSLLMIDAGIPFSIVEAEEIVFWQFNREFYCIVDHDVEVSCAGVLFFTLKDALSLTLSDADQLKFNLLFEVFKEEFSEEDDNLKTEMLRTILKRLIVKMTRLHKMQHGELVETTELNVVRQFNVLVEKNFKQLHQVQDYANLMYKSPKTISNIFSKFHDRSPREIILDRIVLEAKRMLLYTDSTSKEIAHELGFTEIPHFSRFFKQKTQMSPSGFREASQKGAFGNN